MNGMSPQGTSHARVVRLGVQSRADGLVFVQPLQRHRSRHGQIVIHENGGFCEVSSVTNALCFGADCSRQPSSGVDHR